jgi:hypothetical protein
MVAILLNFKLLKVHDSTHPNIAALVTPLFAFGGKRGRKVFPTCGH